MAGQPIRIVFITANVGSIFEEPAATLKIWTEEFLTTIARLDPKFIALHCQEVGGKNYEQSMQHVEYFIELLMNSQELRLFDKVRVYLDEDYSSAEKFTALGSLYLVHESIQNVLMYDFESRRFVEVNNKEIHSGNIENVSTKEKSKFPLEYFPECKWSRKGFLRTRWNLNGTIFDLVNIHLFHDASNFVAIESCPSVYSDTRKRALSYTLDRFQQDEHGFVPTFLFGDFNFRTDTGEVVKKLSEGLDVNKVESEKAGHKLNKIEFKNEDGIVLSLGKKEFSHFDHQTVFTEKDGNWLRKFDRELDSFSDTLFEFDITFPPTYPFEEDSTGDKCYMKTRCPAWCDRVLLTHSARSLVREPDSPESVEYDLMGQNTCMGDHKPVYLKLDLLRGSAKENGSLAEEQVPFSPKTIESILKLACSLEAMTVENRTCQHTRDIESTEPDLSGCKSCRNLQIDRKFNNPGGEEGISPTDESKLIGFLASELKIPEDILKKIDTGQNQSIIKSSDRYSLFKRVNSASVVETTNKKEDWKNSRCNSDFCTSSIPEQSKISKQFHKGNSRIRLISSSKSLNASLPRLTSHHSSSEEEWFEEVLQNEDEKESLEYVDLKMYSEGSRIAKGEYYGLTTVERQKNEGEELKSTSELKILPKEEKIETSLSSKTRARVSKSLCEKPKEKRSRKTFSILNRLTKHRKEGSSYNIKKCKGSFDISRTSFENDNFDDAQKLKHQVDVGVDRYEDSNEKWETIDLRGQKSDDIIPKVGQNRAKIERNEKGCCVLQ